MESTSGYNIYHVLTRYIAFARLALKLSRGFEIPIRGLCEHHISSISDQ